jgi:hypothetical protein
MKKIAVLFCTLFMFSQSALSDDNRKIVAVYPFSGNQDVTQTFQDKISHELLKLNRVVVVNQKTQTAGQATDAFAKSHSLGDYGTQMGATHVLNGVITRANITDKSNDKKALWDASVVVELSVIDVASGRILSSNSFSTKQQGKTKNEVLDKVYKNIVSRSIPFLKNSFPVEGRITAIKEKINPKTGLVELDDFLINLGTTDGMKKKMVFDVYEEVMVNDGGQKKVLENFAGQAKIKEVKGQNFSLCVISKNPAKMQNILNDHQNFIVRTPAEKVK